MTFGEYMQQTDEIVYLAIQNGGYRFIGDRKRWMETKDHVNGLIRQQEKNRQNAEKKNRKNGMPNCAAKKKEKWKEYRKLLRRFSKIPVEDREVLGLYITPCYGNIVCKIEGIERGIYWTQKEFELAMTGKWNGAEQEE